MTPDQAKAIALTQALAEQLGRRPNANDLWSNGIAFGRRQPFPTLQALHEAAGLAVATRYGLAGLTLAEEGVFLRLWGEGKTRREIADALGISPHLVSAEVVDRALTREMAFKPGPKKGELAATLKRRCPSCMGINIGTGPCMHCSAGTPTAA